MQAKRTATFLKLSVDQALLRAAPPRALVGAQAGRLLLAANRLLSPATPRLGWKCPLPRSTSALVSPFVRAEHSRPAD
jgi:hypothetical protein